jgi:alpha-L-fucosidase
MDRYDAYMKGQLRELLTHYGSIGLLWFDGQWESPWTQARGIDLYNYVRSLQPNIIVNNRVGKPVSTAAVGFADKGAIGDYGTPEQSIPPNGFGAGVDWESCMTMNDHWGYNKSDHNWKSTQTLVRNLIDCASKGGNYLLNVGPTDEGVIPGPSLKRLKDIGDWMDVNGQAIYGTSASPFYHLLPWGRCTVKLKAGKTMLYLHVFDWPKDRQLLVPGLKTHVDKAYLLHDKSRVDLTSKATKDGLLVNLPEAMPYPISTTVVLEMKKQLDIDQVPLPISSASNVYGGRTDEYGAQFAFDGNMDTRWATDDAVKQAWVAADFTKPQAFQSVRISEAYAGRIQKFALEYLQGGQWKTIFTGGEIGENFQKSFEPVTAQQFRLEILATSGAPTINEVELLRN